MYRRLVLGLILCVLVVTALFVSACGTSKSNDKKQATNIRYPEKEITLVCPWSAGGSSDLLARAIARSANNKMEKPIIVVNRDGAGGGIATVEVAQTKPDGYTIAVGASGLFTTQPFLKKVNYKIDDFDFLLGISDEPILLTVRADSPYKSLEDLFQRAKAEKLVIKYGNSGMGTVPHLNLAYLFKMANIQSQPVPFKSNTQAIASLMGGHIDVSAAHPGEAIPQIKAGKIRALAISSVKRFNALPDVPTMQEKGYKIDMGVRKFIMVPKGVPAEIKVALTQILERAIADPEFVKAMSDIHLVLEPMKGLAVLDYLKKEAPIMQQLVSDMQISEAK